MSGKRGLAYVFWILFSASAGFFDSSVAAQAIRVWHVDTTAPPGGNGLSWPQAFRDLQTAVDFAEASNEIDVIKVAQGEYKPSRPTNQGDPRSASFAIDFLQVTIQGGYAGLSLPGNPDARDFELYETILSGDLHPPPACLDPDPAAGDCLQATPQIPGCTNPYCCEAVCAVMPDCCVIEWSQDCADEALLSFPECTPPTPCAEPHPDANDCLTANPGPIPGCTNFACCIAVCEENTFCCEIEWDATCALFAQDFAECTSIESTEAYHVVTITNVDPTVRLDGLTITGGVGDGASALQDRGGGLLIDDADPTIVQCTFLRNSAKQGGGAAALGVVPGSNPSPIFLNCRFLGNVATGPGGGALLNVGSDPRLTNCIFAGNAATSGLGGAVLNGVDPGPGLDSISMIINCTFTENTALISGGGVYDEAVVRGSTIKNTVLWQDLGGEVDGPNAVVTFSCIEGGFAGSGNIDSDPQFEIPPFFGPDMEWGTPDDDYGDLRLMLGSPCNDAGRSAAVPPDSADLDGDADPFEQTPLDIALLPRFAVDATFETPELCAGIPVDMGAYENADCNANGIRDEEELLNNDENGDGILDTCQDCNGNNRPDDVDIAEGIEEDCNENGIPDICDSRDACVPDCDGNLVPDSCEMISVGANLREFVPPDPGNGRGLAFDGSDLYYTLFGDPTIYVVTTMGAEVDQITPHCLDETPLGRPIGGLAYADRGGEGTLWAATYDLDPPLIVQVRATDGEIIQTIDISTLTDPLADPPEAIDGLAYDPADNSLFYSSDLGLEVFNIAAVGGRGCESLPGQQNADRGFFLADGDVSGHAFDGTTLYLGQPDDSVTGGNPNTFPGPQVLGTTPNAPTINLHFQPLTSGGQDLKPEDLAFDDVTFSGCVVWANETTTGDNLVTAYEVPCPCIPDCPADLNGDGIVGINDFLDLLAQWGTDPGGPPDLNGDGDVDIVDMLALLANWGPCPESTAAPPPSMMEEVLSAGLAWPQDWDDFEWAMKDPDRPTSEQDNWRCWMDHYLDCHTKPFCFECACQICPDDDPFGGH